MNHKAKDDKNGPEKKAHKRMGSRAEALRRGSINLPEYLWDILEAEALRMRRTVSKQIEFMSVAYFRLEPGLKAEAEPGLAYWQEEEKKRMAS